MKTTSEGTELFSSNWLFVNLSVNGGAAFCLLDDCNESKLHT